MTLDQLVIDIQAQSTDATSGLDRLSASLNSLRAAAKGGVGLTAVSNQLKKLNEALSTMTAPAEKITELVNALKPLASIEKSNLGSAVSQLKKLPEIAASLKSMDMGAFADSIQRVTTAIAPLAAEMQKVANGFSAFPAKIQRIIAQNDRLSSSNGKTSSSFKSLGGNLLATIAKFTAIFYLLKRVAGAISGWVTTSIEYAENLNLFNASMGEYADEMYAYAEKVNEVVGIDPSEWIRNQGAFMALATSIGIASDKAAIMSKNLTQLGYDLSSLWNVDFQTAMDKLQSGLVGQTKAVRTFGLDVTDAAISETALMYGITKTTDAMGQAEKMQLRYITMLRQSTLAQGDLARTLESPQNQLRIFKSQLQQTARALGNIFIPIINAVLPYLMAFVKLLRIAADALAKLFGFTLPEVDYSSLTDGVNAGTDLEDSLDGANGAAKELKGTLAGFDELNVITQTETGGSGGGAGGGVGGGDLGIELPEYDFLGDAVNRRVDDLLAKFKKIAKYVGEEFQPVIDKAAKLGSIIKEQIQRHDWKGVFDRLGKSLVGAVSSAAESVITVVTPVLEGLDLPELAYEGLETLAALLDTIDRSFDSTQKGAEEFSKRGLKPIAEWLNEVGTEALQKLREAFKGIGDWFKENEDTFTRLGKSLGDLIAAVWSVLEPVFNLIIKIGWDTISTILGSTLKFLEAFLPLLTLIAEVLTPIFEIVGGILEILIGIITLDFSQVEDGANQIGDAFTTGFDGIGDAAVGFWENLKRMGTEAWQTISNVWDDVSTWCNTNVIVPVVNFFKGLWTSVSGFFTGLWSDIKGVWGTVVTWFDTKIISPIRTAFYNVTNGIKGFFTNMWTGIKTTFQNVATWFRTNVTEPIGNFFKGAINTVIKALNWMINGLNKIQIKLPNWGILGDLAGRTFGINIQPIAYLASGGQISSGQLFFARENGIPEMVGSMGNKATVANNGQIQEGIADAVYRAIVDSGLIGYIRSIDENAARTADKDLTLGTPNAEAGRWVTRSQNMYAKATG